MEASVNKYEVRIFGSNPYEHTVPYDLLTQVLTELAEERTLDIQERFENNEYKRNSIAFALLDPTAPFWKLSDETLLAIVGIGPERENYKVNALAKAITHRDYNIDCGILAHTQKHRLPDGAFNWGYSVNLNGTIVGASGLAETQDRHQAILFATSFNNKIVDLRKAWEEAHPDNNWLCNFNKPLPRYTNILKQNPRVLLKG